MCGICGIINFNSQKVEQAQLKAMMQLMKHRGPDDEGYVFFHVRHGRFKDEGYWEEKGLDLPTVQGPDEWKQLFNGNGDFNFALGHRRLAIIDLTSSGHQPMSSRANRIWITYNGEIYNFKELRRELENKGHHFFS